jgi:Trk K+ transport system NAD-binding subunit
MNHPYILCGLGRVGWKILEYLQAGSLPIVVMDNQCAADDPRLGRARLIHGDCRRDELLLQAGVADAQGVLIVTSDDLVNITTALTVRRLNPEVHIVIRVVNENLIARLSKSVTKISTLSIADLVGPVLALTALSGQTLGAFTVHGDEGATYQISEVHIQESSPYCGHPIREVALLGVSVLAHLPLGDKGRLLDEVSGDNVLAAGDRLIVCGRPDDLEPLLREVEEEVPPHVLWAGFVRRYWRMLLRTIRDIDITVKITSVVLLAVILLSTLLLHLAGGRDPDTGAAVEIPITDAFYRTISLMATGAEMRGEMLWPWEKVFAAFLRIAGAAVFAAFTAIVVNYLLRAELGGALEVRRIPDKGHVVVCGLGTIGFRAVQELCSRAGGVVVIERAGDNPLVTTVRSLGVPVILGDATVLNVLRRANLAEARAVIASTTNDLVNLEIALLAREKNPQQRVVPCLSDAHLAQSIREAANVRRTLSIPALAAPAFVARLFGDRVLCVFMVQGRLLAVIDLVVQPADDWLKGQEVRDLATTHRLLPLAVFAGDSKPQAKPLDIRLDVNSRLVAVLALPDLERLFRRAVRREV